MITADQILCHLIGDYLLQSHAMAISKRVVSMACLAHVLAYAIPFLWLTPSWKAYLAIIASHFLIDRFGIARYVVYFKNSFLGNPTGWIVDDWDLCKLTGYGPDVPPWLAVWLMIIADNTLHLACNGLALKFL